jgi:hypothetical protein
MQRSVSERRPEMDGFTLEGDRHEFQAIEIMLRKREPMSCAK